MRTDCGVDTQAVRTKDAEILEKVERWGTRLHRKKNDRWTSHTMGQTQHKGSQAAAAAVLTPQHGTKKAAGQAAFSYRDNESATACSKIEFTFGTEHLR